MGNKILLLFFFLTFLTVNLFTQNYTDKDFNITDKLIIKSFMNFHADLSDREVKRTAFEIKRAYFGYSHRFTDNLVGQVILDVQLNILADKYYAFLKIASLTWNPVKGLKINGGMISPKQFKTQERFWGYRYLYKSYQDEYKMGPSADLGVTAEIKFNDYVSVDGAFLNGEGYKHVQVRFPDFKLAGGVTVHPVNSLTIRLYYDNMDNKDTSLTADYRANQSTYSAFVGYKFKKKFRIAGEYNYQKQFKNVVDHDLFGFSFYSTYAINTKFEVFGRVDLLNSNRPEGEPENWFYKGEGTLYMGGLQYNPVKGVKIAINYRNWTFAKPEQAERKNPLSMIYLNLEFKLN